MQMSRSNKDEAMMTNIQASMLVLIREKDVLWVLFVSVCSMPDKLTHHQG